jgi:ERCC4-type nuclease
MRKTDIHYRYSIPTEVTVLVDTREQIPMVFPTSISIPHPDISHKTLLIMVKTKRTKLDFGDYTLEGHANLCTFERKSSQLELFKNLNESNDRIRQAKAFRRLTSSCKFPYLLIEASPSELLSNSKFIKQPELVAHRLALALAKYGLHALFIPWKSRGTDVRRKVGTLMVHIMLGCILKDSYDILPCLLEE